MPSTKRGVSKWLNKQTFPVFLKGQSLTFLLSDLPSPVRLAYVERECDRAGLPSGTYDDAAHERLAAAPAGMRAEADRKAGIARLLVTAGMALSWSQKVGLVTARYGSNGTSELSLQRLSKAIEGVDPINFAPALLADYKGGRQPAECSEEAWAFFLTSLRDGGEGYPLRSAWRDARDLACAQGWQWPCFITVWRRWNELPKADQVRVRMGAEEAARRIAQPALRDKTSILPLEWVSLDGRTKDLWAVGDDGKCLRRSAQSAVTT